MPDLFIPAEANEKSAEQAFEEQERRAIQSLLDKLPAFNPVRRAIQELRSDSLPSSQAAIRLLDVLKAPNARRWREQILAIWQLGELELEPGWRKTVRERLTNIVTKWRSQNRSRQLIAGGIWAIVFSAGFLFFLMAEGPSVSPFGVIAGLTIITGVVWLVTLPLVAIADQRRSLSVRLAAVVALGRLKDVETIAVLAQACRERNDLLASTHGDEAVEVRRAAYSSLYQTLPLLTEAHYGMLAPETIPNLLRLLDSLTGVAEAWALPIVEALGKIADGSALNSVERAAHRAKNEQVRQAATAILPVLRERREQEISAATLLRGSAVSDPAPETLLRAGAEPKATG